MDKFENMKSQFTFAQLMVLKPSSENAKGYIYDGTIIKISSDVHTMFNNWFFLIISSSLVRSGLLNFT